MSDEDHLPEPLPGNPLPLFLRWFREARERAVQPNPDAMVLATVGDNGSPSARVVLCKRIDEQAGYMYFRASPDNAGQRYLYRSRLDGSGTPEAAYTTSASDITSVLIGAGFRSAVDKVKNMQLDFACMQYPQ